MPQFRNSFFLYLAYTFARDSQHLTGLFQSKRSLAVQTKTQLDDFHLPVGKSVQNLLHRILKGRAEYLLEGSVAAVGLYQIRKFCDILLIYRGVKRSCFLRKFNNLLYLAVGEIHVICQLGDIGISAEILS